MVFSFRGISLIKTRVILAFVATTIVIGALFGFFLARGQSGEVASSEPAVANRTSVGLGITYIPISRPISAYYGLGVDSGALVTEVIPDSPADQAGVVVGDVILSFNGTRLNDEVPLLGMIMSCPTGDRVTLEVWRLNGTVTMELLHMERQEE